MNKALFGALVASTFGLTALSAISAELTLDERSELRARAERLHAERAQRPVAASEVDLNRNRGDVNLNQRGELKQNMTKAKKIRKAKKAKRHGMRSPSEMKASVKKVPGALVRR